MDYAVILKEDRLGIMQIRTEHEFLTVPDGTTEDGRAKFRLPQVGDNVDPLGSKKILFIGTEQECATQLNTIRQTNITSQTNKTSQTNETTHRRNSF